ncbi:hypothetical protein WJ437_02570 [Ignavigranum ruoffiae]|uniref:hypothetical protein n=1 Tax=Ignavigranum ruoffiae TaxID=89093 RepID=UPI003AFFA81B
MKEFHLLYRVNDLFTEFQGNKAFRTFPATVMAGRYTLYMYYLEKLDVTDKVFPYPIADHPDLMDEEDIIDHFFIMAYENNDVHSFYKIPFNLLGSQEIERVIEDEYLWRNNFMQMILR